MLNINAQTRNDVGKGVARQLRRDGRIPANLYGAGRPNRNLSLDSKEWMDLVEKHGSGLRTNRQNMVIDEKLRVAVLLRDFQIHPVSGNPVHVDFMRFDPNQKLEIMVPVEIAGEEECPGIKEGGVLQTVRRELEVSCLAGNIPNEIIISVANLTIGDSIHIEDITLPEGVEVHTDVNFTIAAIVGVQAEEVDGPVESEEEGLEEAAGGEGGQAE